MVIGYKSSFLSQNCMGNTLHQSDDRKNLFKQSQPGFQGSARSLVLQAPTGFLTRRGDASKADSWQADAAKVQASQDYGGAKAS